MAKKAKKFSLKDDILQLMDKHFGFEISSSYGSFYDEKTDAFIFRSSSELFTEIVGPKKAKAILKPLAKKYKLKMKDGQFDV